jgi:DNA recombination protein RmuC
VSELGLAIAVAALALAIVVAWTLHRRPPAPDRAAELGRELVELKTQVQQDVGELQLRVARELREVGAEVARQLQDGMKLIQSGQSSVGERLDRATQVVGEVQGSLGKLHEATQRVAEVGREIQGLEQILKSPKVRGGLGETLLAELLGQMLPREHYHLQHGFKSGEKVDAAIVIGGRLVPVDAKFPLENFRRMVAEADEDRRRALRKTFGRDVKNRVEEIAKKYILPDEDTFDFALMYVPAENVYYEMIVKDDVGEDEAIGAYALSRRVVPVSPNSLYAYLQVIILGLRGLQIEANARAIQNDLTRLGGHLDKVKDHFAKLGTHLRNAQAQFGDAERDLNRLEDKLETIERRGSQTELPGLAQ